MAVSQIVDDYMDRLKSELRLVPDQERDEFLREIGSHVYEAYQLASEENDIARILGVLRRLGSPAEVVSGRLASVFVSAGAKRSLPLYALIGLVIALFGIPLGFGGIAILMGVLLTLTGFALAYYTAVGVVFLTASLFAVMGLVRAYSPEFWERLVSFGIIQMNGQLANFLEPLSATQQGLLFILLGAIFAAAGLGLLHFGRHLIRGLRFLWSLALGSLLRLAQTLRRRFRTHGSVNRQEFSGQSQAAR